MCHKTTKSDEIALLLNLLQNYAAKRKSIPSADSVIKAPVIKLAISAVPPAQQGRAAETLVPPRQKEAEKAIVPTKRKKTVEIVVSPHQERDTSDRCLMKTKYQEKFEKFQGDCLLTSDELKNKFQQANRYDEDLPTLQGCICDLLETKNKKAASNFSDACSRSSEAMERFCQFVFSGASPRDWDTAQWKLMADFVKRMAIDAPGRNNSRATAISVLQDIMEELMAQLKGFIEGEKGVVFKNNGSLGNQVRKALGDFFQSYRLIDPEKPKETICLADGFADYIYERVQQIPCDELVPDNTATDVTTNAINYLVNYFTRNINEESATRLLMSSAPGSLWEVKCLQAGISRFEWVRANS